MLWDAAGSAGTASSPSAQAGLRGYTSGPSGGQQTPSLLSAVTLGSVRATHSCPTPTSEGLLGNGEGPFSATEAGCSGSGGVGEGPVVPAGCGQDRQSPTGEAPHTRVSVWTRVGLRV